MNIKELVRIRINWCHLQFKQFLRILTEEQSISAINALNVRQDSRIQIIPDSMAMNK